MILMVVAVVCGLVASYLTSQLIAQKNQKVQLLVAKKAVNQWALIKSPEEMFEVREWPQSEAPSGFMSDIKELKDRQALKDIEQDKPVTTSMLVDKNKLGMEALLQQGTRGLAISVNVASAVAGFIQPGSKVDIVHNIRSGSNSEAKMVLENVLVRAVDQQPVRPEDKAAMIPTTVTLQLTPEQSLKLCAYKDSGNLTLLLRPIGDDTKVDGGKGDLPKIVPPGDQIVEKPRVRHDEGFVQYISNGQSTKQTRFIKRDKKWMNDSERSGDTGPSGSGEGN
jgi:Flp pilus assembly protein CpaB